MKHHKIDNNSTTTEARDKKVSLDLESSEFQGKNLKEVKIYQTC
jgi:hypothetical protein